MADGKPSSNRIPVRPFCYTAHYDTGGGEVVLGAFYLKDVEECANALGIDACWETDCDERGRGPHAHIPDDRFGQPQSYPGDDERRVGLHFRVASFSRLRKPVRWELWHEGDPRRTVFFERVPFIT